MANKPNAGTSKANKEWAMLLLETESRGEYIACSSKKFWRKVLGYTADADAKQTLKLEKEKE